MDRFFDTPARKFFFFALLTILLLATLLGRLFVVPYLSSSSGTIPLAEVGREVLKSSLDGVIAAILTSGVVSVIFLVFTPSRSLREALENVTPADMAYLHQTALSETTYWTHVGHYGRWTSRVAMPALAEAGKTRAATEVTVIVPDPTNDEVLSQLAHMKSGTRSAIKEGPWTAERVQAEIFATLYEAHRWNASANPINVFIFVTPHFRRLRIDMNSAWIAITSDDPRDSAVVVKSGTDIYANLRAEVQCEQSQAKLILNRDISLDIARKIGSPPPVQTKTPDYVRQLGEQLHVNLTPAVVTQVCQALKSPYNKYR